MRNRDENDKLQLTWVQVSGADGRTRMEAHWALAAAAAPATGPAPEGKPAAAAHAA